MKLVCISILIIIKKKLVIYQCNAWDKISSYFLIKKEYIDINIFFNIIKKLIEN